MDVVCHVALGVHTFRAHLLWECFKDSIWDDLEHCLESLHYGSPSDEGVHDYDLCILDKKL